MTPNFKSTIYFLLAIATIIEGGVIVVHNMASWQIDVDSTYEDVKSDIVELQVEQYKKKGAPSSPDIQQSPIDTSTWKTYRNEQYGFEFKYPDQLSLDLDLMGEGSLTGDILIDLFKEPFFPGDSDISSIISISIFVPPGRDCNDPKCGFDYPLTCERQVIERCVEYHAKFFPGKYAVVKSVSGEIANFSLSFSHSLDIGADYIVESLDGRVVNASPSEAFSGPEKEMVQFFDQILSTFRFIR